LAVLAGHIIEKGMIEKVDTAPAVILCVSTFLIVGGANILNDLNDIVIDEKRGSRKPIASGMMSERSARGYFLSLWIGAILLSMTASFLLQASLPLLIVLASILSLYGYERFFKKRGLPGNIIIGMLTGAPFILGASISGPSLIILWIFLMASLSNISREITKDIEDAEKDRGNRITLPMSMGCRKASMIAIIFMLAAVIVSAAPMIIHGPELSYMIPVGLADIIFLMSLTWFIRDSRKAQRMAKLGMICAIFGFVIWSVV
jgi:geranylgeranylglycerol-phosphate geranylgeranyltransferase